jgi:hypothetical protein
VDDVKKLTSLIMSTPKVTLTALLHDVALLPHVAMSRKKKKRKKKRKKEKRKKEKRGPPKLKPRIPYVIFSRHFLP